ncbi:hypothetical protein M409DRAFT_22614 [Zasmidium cellare ATCC 36951]|uniref:Uncharacterized protein n=1 Tax=Zasmidium cellare ATCC 36951 TaxID=1080233 RepID=A0A6A6CJ63_ZASCE|nr:uncharacterized protein M409DRAFT_22614 [Zasmidium cellare ATCC 36951]KAF2167185.1 hypothetical protein M409DRAFT_22614 [Zasmidium cellare ATCC 36951]
MRLLNVHTLQFQEFHDGHDVPAYIIASHRWLTPADEEATYKCVLKKKARDFAELQESINSMFRWYRRARCCLAFLGDVDELLAPATVLFVDRNWERIGYKGRVRKDMKGFVRSENDLTGIIHEITGIRESVLYDYCVSRGLSFEEKQQWVVGRETTREEDKAYCLLGIFNVSMPLVYGEGRKAQRRLLKEIQENEREREAKRERKIHRKRTAAWIKEKATGLEQLQPILEEEQHSPDDSVAQPQMTKLKLLPPVSSAFEDESTREHRNVAIITSLRTRWQAQGSRDGAIHSLARDLEKLGYVDPGGSIHNALHHTQRRSRQAQMAYRDMVQLGWTHERGVQYMRTVLQHDGHDPSVARAMIVEYLMYDPGIVDAGSLPYIPAKRQVPGAENVVESTFDVFVRMHLFC